jgi:hypothetical protein
MILFIRIKNYPNKSTEHRDKLFEQYSFYGQLGFTLLGVNTTLKPQIFAAELNP